MKTAAKRFSGLYHLVNFKYYLTFRKVNKTTFVIKCLNLLDNERGFLASRNVV